MHTIEMSAQEQEQAIETARAVGAEFSKLGPQADRDNTFAYASAAIMKESGLVGLSVPKEFGGMGADIWTTCRIAAELSRGDPGIALAYNMHYIMVGILNGSFTDDQRKEWLPRIADGDILCGTFSEERGFGGLADTKAVPQPGGGWKLYGKKLWGTLSEVSDIWSGSATITDADGNLPTDFEARVAAESNFIVGLDAPGTGPGCGHIGFWHTRQKCVANWPGCFRHGCGSFAPGVAVPAAGCGAWSACVATRTAEARAGVAQKASAAARTTACSMPLIRAARRARWAIPLQPRL